MASRLNPYISFKDDARWALEFYQSVLGGTSVLNTFGEYGDPSAPGADLVMHALLETPAGPLMLADTPPGMEHSPGADIAISLSGDDADDLRRWFHGLAEGGTVTVPLEKQMWGDEFGTLTDKFGITWMVNVAGQSG